MEINQAYQLKLTHRHVKDELGISHFGHWIRQIQFIKEASIEGNRLGMTREELIEYCKQNAKSIAESILGKS